MRSTPAGYLFSIILTFYLVSLVLKKTVQSLIQDHGLFNRCTVCILPAVLCEGLWASDNQWIPRRTLLYCGASREGVLDSTDIMPIYGQGSRGF